MWDHGRIPRYLAKAGLFKNKFLGFFLRSAGQIPVYRASKDAVGAYDAAVAAVRDGKCVVVYPEGTITRDPDLWPMVGKSGAARIALATNAPVIPIGQWGAQEVLAPYAKKPDLFPRKLITMKVGDPVDLSDLSGEHLDARGDHQATDRIMAALTALVEEVRGETAPAERFNPRTAGVSEFGNPNEGGRRGTSAHEQGRGVRCRVVGNGVLDRARRRRQRRDDVGPPRGGRRGDQRPARERGVPPRRRAAARGLGHPRRREGGRRRRHRHLRDALADASARTSRTGRRSSPTTRCWCR